MRFPPKTKALSTRSSSWPAEVRRQHQLAASHINPPRGQPRENQRHLHPQSTTAPPGRLSRTWSQRAGLQKKRATAQPGAPPRGLLPSPRLSSGLRAPGRPHSLPSPGPAAREVAPRGCCGSRRCPRSAPKEGEGGKKPFVPKALRKADRAESRPGPAAPPPPRRRRPGAPFCERGAGGGRPGEARISLAVCVCGC